MSDGEDPELAEAIRRSLGQPKRPAKRRRVGAGPSVHDDQTRRIYNTPSVVRTRSVYAPASGGVSYAELAGDPETLHSVVLAAYCYDREFTLSSLPSNVAVTVVRDGPDGVRPGAYGPGDQRMRPPIAQPNLTEVVAPRPFGKSMMHCKLLICFHATFTRIAVPTGNCVDYDWYALDNASFVIDLPHLDDTEIAKPSRFGAELFRTLTELGVPDECWRPGLEATNLAVADTAGVRLVLSVPGKYDLPSPAWTDDNVGHPAIARAVRELGLAVKAGETLELECQGSSLGDYGGDEGDFLRRIYRSCCGLGLERPRKPASPWDKPPPVPAGEPAQGTTKGGKWVPPSPLAMRILYPTLATVKASHGGTGGGGTIFCGYKEWKKPAFPRELLCDSLSKREGVLMHVKMILALIRPRPGAPARAGYLYVGSHNFTAGAWGRVKTTQRKGIVTGHNFQVSNWELGVIMRLPGSDVEAAGHQLVTWQHPLRPFEASDEPWMQRSWEKSGKASEDDDEAN